MLEIVCIPRWFKLVYFSYRILRKVSEQAGGRSVGIVRLWTKDHGAFVLARASELSVNFPHLYSGRILLVPSTAYPSAEASHTDCGARTPSRG
jgi:hypothetical protein